MLTINEIDVQLSKAVEQKDIDKIKSCLSNGANPNAVVQYPTNPNYHDHILSFFIYPYRDQSKHNPEDIKQIVTMFLAHGANPNFSTADLELYSPLLIAMFYSSTEVINLILTTISAEELSAARYLENFFKSAIKTNIEAWDLLIFCYKNAANVIS